MKFSYDSYQKEFGKRMRELENAFHKGDVLKTICYVKYLSCFYYTINYKLTDDRLEEITKAISIKFLGNTRLDHSHEDTILFYDNFGLKNRGLASIYVKALETLGYKIVWVLYANALQLDEIKKAFGKKENITFLIIPSEPILERMQLLKKAIIDVSPKHIFLYTTPDDVCGIGVISTINGAERYLIDLTDHAFWLGRCALDWIIGFRNYGYNIAVQFRKISPDRVMILPYYPDARDEYPYEGMPFDTAKYEFVFSGGSPYKIEGDETYQEIVTYLLDRYPDMRFVFAGNGTNQSLEELKEKFPDRFFRVDERKDLDAVLKRAKFYLSTYPILGGLMGQYALRNQCIPLSLCGEKGALTDPKTWVLDAERANFVFYKKEKLFSEIDRLLTDDSYYEMQKDATKDQIISEEEFTVQLGRVLAEKKTKFPLIRQKISIDKFLEIYKKNATYDLFCRIIYNSKNKWIYKKHPFIVKKMERIQKNDNAQ